MQAQDSTQASYRLERSARNQGWSLEAWTSATAKKIRKMADEKLAEDAAAALEGKYAPYHFKRMGGILSLIHI